MNIQVKTIFGKIIIDGDFTSLADALFHNRANLRGADLCDANLCDANLRGADLRGANLCDAPFAVQHLDAKILAAIENGGVLDMKAWHTCETTHCRGGWAVVMAGAAGKTLEWVYGSNTAAALIYGASRPKMKVPDFTGSLDNDAVLDDIRDCAAADPLPKS